MNGLSKKKIFDNMVKYISVIFMEQTTQYDCIKRIRKAIETGSIEQIKELLPITDMTNDNGVSIILASQKGHVEIVKLLLTVCDASKEARMLTTPWGKTRRMV